MSVDRKQIEHIAALANLDPDPADLDRFTRELNRVLGFVAKLEELSLEQVEPTFAAIEAGEDRFRTDESRPSIPAEEALGNAPRSDRGQFLVPRILS